MRKKARTAFRFDSPSAERAAVACIAAAATAAVAPVDTLSVSAAVAVAVAPEVGANVNASSRHVDQVPVARTEWLARNKSWVGTAGPQVG
jgi:hypothetical protein